MDFVRKTYVEFFYPGLIVDEVVVKEVESRDISRVEVPKAAFGFRFFDILTVTVEDGSELVELASVRRNKSQLYYYGGRILTLSQVRRELPYETILISNMEGNCWDKVIQTRAGTFKPFQNGDIHLKVA